jgi:hypothetical protein
VGKETDSIRMIQKIRVPGGLVEFRKSGLRPPDVPDHDEAVLLIREEVRGELNDEWESDNDEDGEVNRCGDN